MRREFLQIYMYIYIIYLVITTGEYKVEKMCTFVEVSLQITYLTFVNIDKTLRMYIFAFCSVITTKAS